MIFSKQWHDGGSLHGAQFPFCNSACSSKQGKKRIASPSEHYFGVVPPLDASSDHQNVIGSQWKVLLVWRWSDEKAIADGAEKSGVGHQAGRLVKQSNHSLPLDGPSLQPHLTTMDSSVEGSGIKMTSFWLPPVVDPSLHERPRFWGGKTSAIGNTEMTQGALDVMAVQQKAPSPAVQNSRGVSWLVNREITAWHTSSPHEHKLSRRADTEKLAVLFGQNVPRGSGHQEIFLVRAPSRLQPGKNSTKPNFRAWPGGIKRFAA